nr:hypothetical protein [Tanacetum cinerariifolium]
MQIAQLGIANQHGNGNVIVARAESNSKEINGNQIRCYNCRGEVHYASNCTVYPRKQNAAYIQQLLQVAQEEEARIQSTQEEFKFMAAPDASEETERVKANCILENNLQQVSTFDTQSDKALVYESNGSAEAHLSKFFYDNDIFNMFTQDEQYTELLEPIPKPHQSLYNGKVLLEKHDPPTMHDSEETLELAQENTLNIQTKLERTKERFEYCIIKKENEYAKLWNDWYKKSEECKYDKISYDKSHNDMQQKIERLQTQLGDLKGKSKITSYVSNTLDPLSQKVVNENVELEFQGTTRGTSANTKFAKQSILRKPPSSSRPKLYDVTPLSKSMAFPKVGEMHALSKPVTSNLVPTPTESKVIKNDNVISLGIFRINPFKASRQCLITVNHDVYLLNYVNGMNSHGKKQKENVSNQKKHKAQVWKPKNVGSKERLASPKPSTPRSYLR